ncbi:endolytic peptidoglycan transglycosylase RlpA [Erwinia amylovora]|uniref:endolytic peptidoglycan transglycosylase RlpA n=1 Tax=Erwinia amylovora TaxID=552 RepID=UPI0014449778|nr:endolytic peptidoglycan transglycosylase RlpA [Erwinia amylovora]
MRKDWLGIALASALLTACSTDNDQQAPVTQQQPAYNGPVVEIGGAEPQYEPVNPATAQDYTVNGTGYKIVKDPSNFSQTGIATSYGDEKAGNQTATGERFDANAMTAAHPTLPLPSYVRVTNLANGRMIVVRVNDRGPYTPGRIIDLSRAASDRLNTSNNTRVRIDYISVAADGSLSGPGTIGTTVAKQSYALPSRPDIGGGIPGNGGGVAVSAPTVQPAQGSSPQQEAHPLDNATLSNSDDAMGAPVRSSGFLGAAQPLQRGVLESSEPEVTASAPTSAAAKAPAAASTAAGGNYVVQVGALNNPENARQMATSLGKRFGVAGTVESRGNIYRVQLGRFSSRQQAAVLQQRLANEAQQQSFITVAPGAM